MAIEITFRSLARWPVKQTASRARQNPRFKSKWSQTIDLLEAELAKISAKNVVIEADCDASQIRLDGHLRSGATLRGPGVIVSFDCRAGSLRFPCDTFTHWQANVRAIALSLEALRTVDRYGVTKRSEQYTGWAALPDKTREKITAVQDAAEWMVQKCFANSDVVDGRIPTVNQLMNDLSERRRVYKGLAWLLHPDRNGGIDHGFKELQKHMEALGE